MRARLRKCWPRTLRGQLVLGTTAVVSTVLITLGGLTVWNLRQYVINIGDIEVEHSLAAFAHSFDKSRGLAETSAPRQGALTEFVGQAPGNLIVVLRNGTVVESAAFSDGEPRPAPADAVEAVEGLGIDHDDSMTARLGTDGIYRLQSRDVGDGYRLVSAVSLTSAWQAAGQKTVTIVGLVLAALAITAVSTILIARYALRPLRRVAAVASRVAALPLANMTDPISLRVGRDDVDPSTEVGTVGRTLNALLDSVDSALAERSDSDRRIRQFLTDASHELRTPLASIQGYAELTRQDSSELPETTEYALARIESEARRMTSLVNDLLLLSRLDERQDLDQEDVDLSDLVCDAVNDIAVSAPDHVWQAELPPDPLWVRGDLARLYQLVSNLLTNARVHTPAGVRVRVSVRILRRPDAPEMAELVVQDNGPGISPDILPILFDRFVRQDNARYRNAGSNGLGLAIAASIAEAHGGTITVHSTPGKTIFTVLLPLTVEAASNPRTLSILA